MYRADHLFEGERDCVGASGRLLPVRGSDGAAAPCPLTEQPAIVRDQPRASEPSKGTFLKETIVLRDAAGAALVAAVMEEFAALRQLRRKRQAGEIESEQQLLSCILANGLCCHWYRTAPLVSFQRKADAEFYGKRNRPPWLSAQALGRAVEGLVEADLADLKVGHRGISSGYELKAKLLQLAIDYGITERSLGVSFHYDDLVRLKGRRPKPTFDPLTGKTIRHDAERINFEETPQTKYWRDGLAAYNEFVAAQDIEVEPPDHDAVRRWLTKLNNGDRRTGAKFRRPELYRRAVYRVFNEATVEKPTFDKGGRLASGWWMNAPEDVRALITINGEPTVELDYSACHPRMLYHELGLEAPKDPYDIPQVAALEREDGRKTGAYRDVVKWQFQVLINGGSRPDLVPVPDDIELPASADLSGIRRLIRERHEPISSAFRSRAGLRLMNAESEIAFAIISTARGKGWLALPVHDAFIVQASRESELRTMMIDEYEARFGQQPTITKKDRAS